MTRLEPEKFGYDYNKNEALYRLRSSWLGGTDYVRTEIKITTLSPSSK